MADLTDHNMERLSRLFASGDMRHAREIARLLNLERTERCSKADPLSSLLEDFLHGWHDHSRRPRAMNFSEVAITIFAAILLGSCSGPRWGPLQRRSNSAWPANTRSSEASNHRAPSPIT
jgi:hypothetical protein